MHHQSAELHQRSARRGELFSPAAAAVTVWTHSPARAPLNNDNRAQRSTEASRARRVAQVMAVALGKRRNAALDASGPALRGFQANPRSAFDRQPACLQSGALIADLPESLSALSLFRGALVDRHGYLAGITTWSIL